MDVLDCAVCHLVNSDAVERVHATAATAAIGSTWFIVFQTHAPSVLAVPLTVTGHILIFHDAASYVIDSYLR